MKTLDAGHKYELNTLDGGVLVQLQFVKRVGPKFPGNTTAYPGTTMQEVLRAVIDRLDYINNQIPAAENAQARKNLIYSIRLFEERAAKRHGRVLNTPTEAELLHGPFCPECGHIQCPGHGDKHE